MDNAQVVDEMRRLLRVEAPKVTVSNPEQMLAFAGQLSPDFKVKLMLAMGFTGDRPPHQQSCVSLQGSGLICTCVAPPTVWIAPHDVDVLRHETREERKAETDARNEQDEEDAENEFWVSPVL